MKRIFFLNGCKSVNYENISPFNNLSWRKFNLSGLTLTDIVIVAKPADFKSSGILHARRKWIRCSHANRRYVPRSARMSYYFFRGINQPAQKLASIKMREIQISHFFFHIRSRAAVVIIPLHLRSFRCKLPPIIPGLSGSLPFLTNYSRHRYANAYEWRLFLWGFGFLATCFERWDNANPLRPFRQSCTQIRFTLISSYVNWQLEDQ